METVHVGIAAALVAGIVAGAGSGVLLGPDQSVVEKNVTHEYVYRLHTTTKWDSVRGSVHLEQSEGGNTENHYEGDNLINRSLSIFLTATGGDVRATWTPGNCGNNSCRVVIETENGGSQGNASIHDPSDKWTWRVEAAEMTVEPIDYRMTYVWYTTSYVNETAEHPPG